MSSASKLATRALCALALVVTLSPSAAATEGSAPASARAGSVTGGERLQQYGLTIFAASPTDVLAGGINYGREYSMFLKKLNGARWRTVDVAHGGGPITDIAGQSPDDVWAVGYTEYTHEPIALHWDGSSMSAIAVPDTAVYREFKAVAPLSPTNVLATGRECPVEDCHPYGLRWNGSRWKEVSARLASLSTFAVVSESVAWGFGPLAAPRAMRWDGEQWRRVAFPTGDSARVKGAAAIGADDAWAVGGVGPGSAPTGAAWHWDGTAWTAVDLGLPVDGVELTGVAAVSADDVWAVGEREGSDVRSVVYRWDGVEWHVVDVPDELALQDFADVTASADGSVWVIGDRDIGSPVVIAKWDGAAWQVQH